MGPTDLDQGSQHKHAQGANFFHTMDHQSHKADQTYITNLIAALDSIQARDPVDMYYDLNHIVEQSAEAKNE